MERKDKGKDPMMPFGKLEDGAALAGKYTIDKDEGDYRYGRTTFTTQSNTSKTSCGDKGVGWERLSKILGVKMTKEIEHAVKAANNPATPTWSQALIHKYSNAQKAMVRANG